MSSKRKEVMGSIKAIGIDEGLCRGCGLCELACSLLAEGVCDPNFSRISVSRDFFAGRFTPKTCKQCREAKCMLSCPVEGAMAIDLATGARIIIKEACTGCGECSTACPFNSDFGIIKRMGNKFIKCDMCSSRSEEPICVNVCPTKALYVLEMGDG
ncbi:MAG: 4Fe-4S dicluster domain-containing protein [Thermoproteota archaeon]